MLTIDDMVQREINCCVSGLVSTLAKNAGTSAHGYAARDLEGLIDQANELSTPVLDYEEAAIQAGWTQYLPRHSADAMWIALDRSKETGTSSSYETAEELCAEQEIEPYEWEVYEFWAVSNWLAEKLTEQGEKVDTGFAGLNVWARTTTGQAISMDGCIQKIYADMMAPETFPSVAPGA